MGQASVSGALEPPWGGPWSGRGRIILWWTLWTSPRYGVRTWEGHRQGSELLPEETKGRTGQAGGPGRARGVIRCRAWAPPSWPDAGARGRPEVDPVSFRLPNVSQRNNRGTNTENRVTAIVTRGNKSNTNVRNRATNGIYRYIPTETENRKQRSTARRGLQFLHFLLIFWVWSQFATV